MNKVAIIGNQGFSMLNFRGPLIRAMVARGHKVLTLAPDFQPSHRNEVKALGAEPIDFSLSRTGLNPLRDLWDFVKLWRLLRRLKPDVTLAYAIKPVIYGTLAAWLAGVPRRFALIEGLGYAFTPSGEREPLKRKVLRFIAQKLYRLALPRATRVFFLNPDDLKEFVEKGLVPKDKAFLLGPIGVDLSHFAPAPPVKEPVTFLLAARLLREKGIVEFAQAARRLRAKYPNTRFVLLGGLDTNPGAIRKEEVEAWVREGILEWPGHVPDVRPWLAQASVFVLPSYYREGVPRSIQEAMAMARPVITTDAPGCRETVIPGVNGFLVPPRDVEALASAMEKFIREPELIERMGRESRRIAEERFDVHKVNQILLREMAL
ncbi:MAG: glycosyltransferase family 4 protein [Candidatus Bipolaricaulota bacterium]|nr:glycosyltransferase family 4 protein [Candidatus Bipolaricaulota bacterium]MDW8126944.1 glycosyltransferase family 4 protein [Candidatus Bipolaricaulota bacterium]